MSLPKLGRYPSWGSVLIWMLLVVVVWLGCSIVQSQSLPGRHIEAFRGRAIWVGDIIDEDEMRRSDGVTRCSADFILNVPVEIKVEAGENPTDFLCAYVNTQWRSSHFRDHENFPLKESATLRIQTVRGMLWQFLPEFAEMRPQVHFRQTAWSPSLIYDRRDQGDSLLMRIEPFRRQDSGPHSDLQPCPLHVDECFSALLGTLSGSSRRFRSLPRSPRLPDDSPQRAQYQPSSYSLGPCYEYVPPLKCGLALLCLINGLYLAYEASRSRGWEAFLLTLEAIVLSYCVVLLVVNGHENSCHTQNNSSDNRHSFQHNSAIVPQKYLDLI